MARLLALLLVPASLAAQGSQELEVIPVQGNVYMLQTAAAGGNVGVLPGPDGVLLVDNQVPNLSEAVVRGVRRITDEPLRFVINTHVHIDHIGGNTLMAGMGATIIAQENVHRRMLRELRIPRGGGRFMPQPAESARPIMTFGETATFRMNGEEVQVFHVPPAHTDGDSFVYFVDSDVLHAGDVFRTNMYPIVDVYNGGTVGGMIEAMEIAVDLAGPDTKVIPGHGFGYTDRDGLIEFLDMLTDVYDTIREMVAEGLWLDEVLEAGPTAAYDARWRGTESWNEQDLIPIIYSEVGGAAPTVPR
ncbi:MAG: MBL fold metallo-hydrolase [Gemmatimonadota bacterium]|nr:MBL fold metallo-hydrolase [Gemmatimonadota bacterium]MDH3422120.1 MBL fold metallo-hydrolase [Gemmatimonadota bacterium]